MTTPALERELDRLGHRIQASSITKIEKGDRRVDVDDLVALAVALRTTPNALLLPDVDRRGVVTRHNLTESHDPAPTTDLWEWATGEVPLGAQPSKSSDSEQVRQAEFEFAAENRPHHFGYGSRIVQDLAAAIDRMADSGEIESGDLRTEVALEISAGVLYAFASGYNTADVRDVVESAITMCLLLAELPDLPDRARAAVQRFRDWQSEIKRLAARPEDSGD